MKRSLRQRFRRDQGQASLEMVALLPVLLFIGLVVLQAGVAMWTASSTQEAARQSARAFSLDGAGAARRAAEGALPGSLTVEQWNSFGPDFGVRLTVKVPRVSPLPQFTVTREAVMP